MKALSILTLCGLISIGILNTSCQHEPELLSTNPEVCFDREVLPVIKSSCTMSGCHDGDKELPPLDTYEDLLRLVKTGKPVSSKLHEVLTANPNSESFMPPKPNEPLTSAQINAISLWILQGAKHTTCNDIPCDTLNVTFTGSILPITDTYCKGCHSGSNPDGGVTLTNYTTVKASIASGRFMGSVEQKTGFTAMPKGSSKLPACNITQLKKWINNGMPNN